MEMKMVRPPAADNRNLFPCWRAQPWERVWMEYSSKCTTIRKKRNPMGRMRWSPHSYAECSRNCRQCMGRCRRPTLVLRRKRKARSTLTCLLHHLYQDVSSLFRIAHFSQESDAGAAHAVRGFQTYMKAEAI